MGHEINVPPINEGVNLLNSLAPSLLEDFRRSFSDLGEELYLGRIGGTLSNDGKLNVLRAKVLISALQSGRKRAEAELELLRKRMSSARKFRLGSQLVSLVCSSGVLGAIAIGDKNTTVATAILSVIASIGVIIAENKERLLKQGDGDVYMAFEAAGQAAYKAALAAENLNLISNLRPESDELPEAIAEANAICEELNGWIIKISGSRS